MQDLRLTGQVAFGWPDGFFRNDRPSVNSAFPLQEVAIAWLAGRCIAAGAGILIPLTNDDFFPADGAARFCFRFERFPNDGSLRLVRRPCAINAAAAPAIDADPAHACWGHKGRSEERRVGKVCVRKLESRWAPIP